MKEINLAAQLIQYRKEKQLTQEDLANYMGVSKAAVSKWETAQSYPDITLLPVLAAYFNTTVDSLLGYKPQLAKGEIRRIYQKFCRDFVSRPFDEVITELRQLAKEYYACFPLLFQLGTLLLNHGDLAGSRKKEEAIYEEAKELFQRVKRESRDMDLVQEAHYMEAYCLLLLQQTEAALELLEPELHRVKMTGSTLLSQIYMKLGRPEEANTVLQAEAYQCLCNLFACLPSLLTLYQNDASKLADCLAKAEVLNEAFGAEKLQPGMVLPVWLVGAECYAALGEKEKALALLERYTRLATGDIYPLKLQGNSFFDALEGWFEDLELGSDMPRSDSLVKQSMWQIVAENPAFAPLEKESRYRALLSRLQHQTAQ